MNQFAEVKPIQLVLDIKKMLDYLFLISIILILDSSCSGPQASLGRAMCKKMCCTPQLGRTAPPGASGRRPRETQGQPLGFWSPAYRSEACCTPPEKEILAAWEGFQTVSEVIGTEAQLLLPVICCGRGKCPCGAHKEAAGEDSLG